MAGAEQVAPLARMWRAVYKKAAEVAEARAVELLKYHVYVYPHGAGGGGGGGWVLLEDRAVAPADATFSALPQTYRDLRFVVEGRAVGASQPTAAVRLQLSATVVGNEYRSTLHYAQVGGGNHGIDAALGASANTDYYALAGHVPTELADDAATTGVLDVVVYGYTRTDRYKRFYALNTLTGAAAAGAQTRHASGEWRSTAAVVQASLYPAVTTGWATGSRIRVYGWADAAPAAALTARVAALEARLAARAGTPPGVE